MTIHSFLKGIAFYLNSSIIDKHLRNRNNKQTDTFLLELNDNYKYNIWKNLNNFYNSQLN